MTLDKRAKKLAHTVADYCLDMKNHSKLYLQGEDSFLDFMHAVGDVAESMGAEVIYDPYNLKERREMIERADSQELKENARETFEALDTCDSLFKVSALSNPEYLAGIDDNKMNLFNTIYIKPFIDRQVGKNGFSGKRWNVTGYPCESTARLAGMSLKEFEDFAYGACLVDWSEAEKEMKKVKDIFDKANEVRIFVPNQTDLTFSLEGRGGQVSMPLKNMPSGEVFYGPVEDSLNGEIFFPYNSNCEGKFIKGIKLVYKNGEVVDFSAEKNEKALESVLNRDGMKRVGEFGIGCNYGIKKYVTQLLYDEKIGGTIHLALGESYPYSLDNGGGLNKADNHWDIICDLRKVDGLSGGEIYAEGKLVQKNGKFIF